MIGIIVVLSVLLVPAFTTLKGAGDITNAAYTVSGALEEARTLAISKNTYVWLGFYEEAAYPTGTPNTTATPPYPGVGRLIIAIVYSNDGSEIFSPTAAGPNPLPASRITQSGKVIKIDNVHMTDIGSPPSSTPIPTPAADSVDVRSNIPYIENASTVPPSDHFNRVSSDSSDATRFHFILQGYTFWKTVRFSPRGEARINTSYDYRRVAEIGLRPTHGNALSSSPNVVAIQFNAFGGHFKIYRR